MDDHYIVSARKYRPSTFATVIGQHALTAALRHAVATNRLAHAYLFCGSRGVGKTSCARIFAKTINCESPTPDGEACNQCASCRMFNNGTSLNIVELDAASHNGVDDIKSLIEQVLVPPTLGRYRVFIIDEVHMLSSAAFNAFLKTLEEPPEHAIFILATTEKHKIIPTILSRCQIYDFNRITIIDMVDHLASVAANEGIEAERPALSVIARKADGAMRDALSIFDQVAASSMGKVTYQSTIDNLNILDSAYYSRLVEAFLAGNVQNALLIYKEIRDKGFDSQFFINGLGLFMRDLMVAMSPATLMLLETDDEEKARLAQLAAKCPPPFIYRAMDLCNEADLNYRTASNKQFLIELTLVKLCQLCSPSPGIDGGGEGQLKPIAATPAAPSAPAAAPKPAAAAPKPAAAAPQPAPAAPRPTTTAPKPQPRPSAGANPLISLSIKGATGQKASKTAEEAPATRRSQPYTDEDIARLWKEYIDAHPTERILVNTMIAAKPKLIEKDKYLVPVDDSIQVDTFNESLYEILTFFHDKLSNDDVTFVAQIVNGESSPIVWTQREVLQYLVQSRPQLTDLIETFKLALK